MKTPLFAFVVLFLPFFSAGCDSIPTEKIRKEIAAFQKMADEIGLENYESTWSGNVSTTWDITRENGYRIGEFEHKNPVKPVTRFRTRLPLEKPSLDGAEILLPEPEPAQPPAR